QDLVDFSPVYRCFHIYSVLPEKTYEELLPEERRKQAGLVLQPPSNMHETLSGYRKYFNQIVGFFVIEDHILHTSQGLVDRAYIDELWDMALSKTIAALRTHSSYCSDPDLVLDLKNLIVLFADTLQAYGFPVTQLFDLLLEIQDQYRETLLKKWAGAFRNILDLDNYSPISVADEEQYEKLVGQFPFHDAELEKQPFPRKFPFSELVPRVYNQIKEFIYACLKFSEDLHLSSTEVDDMIRKSTNLLLTRTLSSCFQNAIRKKNIGLTELVQIIINTTHLERSCRFLEEFITNITNVLPETVHTTKLYGTATFKDGRHAAEEEIYTNLNQKIDQFLQLADYDWMAVEAPPKASDYLVDLIAFLRSTFAVFTHLPGKVAQTACMSACKHLSTSLMQQLLEAEVRQLSLGALQQFSLDVAECEQFARSGPVPGFQGDTLLLAFIDLRQVGLCGQSWSTRPGDPVLLSAMILSIAFKSVATVSQCSVWLSFAKDRRQRWVICLSTRAGDPGRDALSCGGSTTWWQKTPAGLLPLASVYPGGLGEAFTSRCVCEKGVGGLVFHAHTHPRLPHKGSLP
uniref:Exocyst complex component 6B n=1 Tax=Laticauda laticaudata TaxID=8630 RepID=A0A8C5WZL4_LATLA